MHRRLRTLYQLLEEHQIVDEKVVLPVQALHRIDILAVLKLGAELRQFFIQSFQRVCARNQRSRLRNGESIRSSEKARWG